MSNAMPDDWDYVAAGSNAVLHKPCGYRRAYSEAKRDWWICQDCAPSLIYIPDYTQHAKLRAELLKTRKPVVCECGAESVGSNIHSSWCPKAS